MRKISLNLYEQELPPNDVNNLWVDIDENTGDIKAIHRYNKSKGEWEPYMVSLAYITPGEDAATIIKVDSEVAVRVSNVDDTSGSSGMPHQLIQVVLPESPYYGDIVGTHSRTVFMSEGNMLDEEDEDSKLMDVMLNFTSRNGYPFNCSDYKTSVLRIVPSVEDLTTDDSTVTYDGSIPYVKFIFYNNNLTN